MALMPRCGWGGDIPGFTDMQWYMYHQHNVAHFAAFSPRAMTPGEVTELARTLLRHAPQLMTGYAGPHSETIPEDVLQKVSTLETVQTFDGFPEIWLNAEDDILTAGGLPLFRMRVARRAGGPDAQGRAGYVQVRVSHALVEGMDSALLSRSQKAAHEPGPDLPPPPANPWPTIVGRLASLGHLIAGNAYTPHPGPFAQAVGIVDRRRIGLLARRLGVRQRALLFAIVLALLFDQGGPAGKAKVSGTYSTIDSRAVARDRFMRMRMLFATFRNGRDLAGLAGSVDAEMTRAETAESGFAAAMDAAAIHAHRRLSRLIPFAYRPRLFQFMPFDIIIGLIPPHRLDGPLAENLIEPVFAGASTPGGNGCVIVPNRGCFTFNFHLQEKLLPRLDGLEQTLKSFEDAAP